MRRWLVVFAVSFQLQAAESVYKISPLTDGMVLGACTATVTLPYAFSSSWISKRCPCDPNEVNGFDRSAIGNNSQTAIVLSDVTMAAVIVGPAVFNYFDVGLNEVFLEDAVVFAEALLVTGALTTVTKHIVQRPIPRTYTGDPYYVNSVEGYRSFFSGHTSTAFAALSAFAMTLNYRYDLGVWPWIGVGVLGASVALERVAGGVHFYSDVIVGAAVGTGVGVLVPWLHRRPVAGGNVSLLPSPRGIFLQWGRLI